LAKQKTEKPPSHDACVRNLAADLKKDNWLVQANARGWEKPSEIGGVVPDVVAHKGCLKRICQIVTKKDFEGNETQWRDFKNYCKEYNFQMYVIEKNGKLSPFNPEELTKK